MGGCVMRSSHGRYLMVGSQPACLLQACEAVEHAGGDTVWQHRCSYDCKKRAKYRAIHPFVPFWCLIVGLPKPVARVRPVGGG